ncbi:SDR family NAD(P)-dependent oxidoreductase, partial [Athalassotoga sp.]|uniref:SDR family NAD(P)-dependent oxidoreductase n=1 Tax=Athalassotoga sp. TaxID=2022597 RepID=UPI003D0705B9
MRFENKVVMITGSAKGIGKAIAEGFAREGALLALTDLDANELEKTATSLKNISKMVRSYVLDVTKSKMVEEVVKNIIEDFKVIDILI